MTRKRTILFLGILLALLIIPTTLPYLIAHLVLPFWSYLLYAFVLLVNAGIYLANRLWLIDKFFVQGRIGAFFVWNLLVLLAAFALEILALDLSGMITVGGELTVTSVDGYRLAQRKEKLDEPANVSAAAKVKPIIIAESDHEKYEPLIGVYDRDAYPLLKEALDRNDNKVIRVITGYFDAVKLEEAQKKAFRNVNTKTDYKELEQ